MNLFSLNKISLLILIFSLYENNSRAQEIEPRNYANIPKGLNVAALSYSLSSGSLVTEGTSPIKDSKITSHTFIFTYVRSFGLFGKLGKIQLNVPFSNLHGSAKLNGIDTSITRTGFADTRLKIGLNLIGSPALAVKDFVKYKQETIFGASFVIAIPTGQYLDDKVINLGSNRWGFKPELGMSRRVGSLYLELYSGVWFFTVNNKYLKTNKLKQDPIFTFQGHIAYTFPSQIWLAINGGYADGGETSVNEVHKNDFQKNWRLGATISVPLGIQHSIKFLGHTGVATSSGLNFTIYSLAYQYSWF